MLINFTEVSSVVNDRIEALMKKNAIDESAYENDLLVDIVYMFYEEFPHIHHTICCVELPSSVMHGCLSWVEDNNLHTIELLIKMPEDPVPEDR